MNYLEQNRKEMERSHYYLYEKLYGTEEEQQIPYSARDNESVHLDDIFVEMAKNGEKVLNVSKGNKKYRMNSSYNPTYEAERWAEQFKFRSLNNIVTVFGFGNGIMIEKIIDRLGTEDYLIIYEPAMELFNYVMKEYDLKKIFLFEKVFIFIKDVNELDFHHNLDRIINITNIKSQIQCVIPCYEELFPESCVAFRKELRDVLLHAVYSINTEVAFGRRFLENDFYNLRYLKDSYILDGISPYLRTDLPAIIVAAGPSVHENLDKLKEAKGRAYLIVVDRVLDYVLDHGIEPDFIVTIDPIKPIEYFTVRNHVDYPLMTDMSANRDILKKHQGMKIFINCDLFLQTIYEDAGVASPRMTAGTSVATAAFAACIKLGFNKIVLVGQDLAYDGEFTHAGGIAEDPVNTFDLMVEGISGEQVASRYDWKDFIDWFKDMIHLHPEITVFDTKTKGARISGAVLKSLDEVLEVYGAAEPCDLSMVLTEANKAFSEESYQKVLAYFNNAQDDLRDMRKKVRQAVELAEKQIQIHKNSRDGDKNSIKNYKKLTEINKYLEEKNIYQGIDVYIASLTADDITTMYHRDDTGELDTIITYRKSKSIYEAIQKGIDFIQPLMEEGIDEMPK